MRRGFELRSLVASKLAGYAVITGIGLQVVLPALALVDDPPARFGFQMYSAMGGISLQVVNAAGEPIDVDLEAIVTGSLRPEFDWTGVLPERVCQAAPAADRVIVEQDGLRRVIQCV